MLCSGCRVCYYWSNWKGVCWSMAKDCKCRQCHCLIVSMFCFWTNIGCSSPSRLLPSYIYVKSCLSSLCDERLVAFLIGMTFGVILCQIFKSYVSTYTLQYQEFGSYMHGNSRFIYPGFYFGWENILNHTKRQSDLDYLICLIIWILCKFVARTCK